MSQSEYEVLVFHSLPSSDELDGVRIAASRLQRGTVLVNVRLNYARSEIATSADRPQET